MKLHARRALSTATAALLAASSALALPTSATAATGTQSVTFQDCQLEKYVAPSWVPQGSASTWTTPLVLAVPSPIPARQSVTTDIDLGSVPAGVFPEQLTAASADVTFRTVNATGSETTFTKTNAGVGTFNPALPLDVPAYEVNKSWSASGYQTLRPHGVEIRVDGKDPSGTTQRYKYVCDLVVSATPIITFAVYDLNKRPEAATTSTAVRQGKTFRLTGANFLVTAPTSPAAKVTVTVAGTAAGKFSVDQTGAFAGIVTVPPFTKPGSAVPVKVTNGSKSATVVIKVTAAKAKVRVAKKKVRSGRSVKVTGSAFKPGEKVTLRFKGGKGSGKRSFTKTVKAKSSGKVATSITLKKAAKGSWKVTAKGVASGRSATATLKVS